MCGIFGLVSKNGSASPDQVRELTNLAAHRGPDGVGVHTHGAVGLGHRRLAIIDLSSDGAQPMRHRERPLWIIYNGEIYNYVELREELQAAGARFASKTDTEVILEAYARWGEACLDRFNGMWSFAIYDEQDGSLFCARDRFGVKPFYYTSTPACFAFASEIRQLLPLRDERVADHSLVSDFLLTGLSDHTPRTFFEGIDKLPPGHWMRVSARSGEFVIKPYYRLTPDPDAARATPDAAAARVRTLLRDAVRLRLRSDVRVGTCLSGGLDSSSVATLAQAIHRQASAVPFCAITAVSEQASNNEEAYAQEVVEASSLDWHRTTPTYADFAATIDQLIDVQEEPFGGPSIMMQHAVMKTARGAGIPVLLDGQGGDETLLGYERYYAAWLHDHLTEAGWRGFVSSFRQAVSVNANLSNWRLAKYFLGASFRLVRGLNYRLRYRFLKNNELPDVLKRFSAAVRDARRMQILEITESNLPMLLRFEDKNAMHFGVETRLPFLDYRFVEYAVGLPTTAKLRNGWSKWALREAMDALLPRSIAWRRDKIGFAAPDQLWLRQHAEIMRDVVTRSALLSAFVDVDAVKRGFADFDLGMQWRLYCVALWAERFGVVAR